MSNFNYEWWTVEITSQTGTCIWEFKGKDKDHIIKQINKEVEDSNSEKNLLRDVWHRKPMIIKVHWNTLKLDRIGYQRLS